jgi:L-aspartate oxidase
VAHAGGSATGRRILRELSAVVAEHPRIEVLEGRRAAALRLDGNRRCAGLDTDDGQEIAARAVVLATGGAAALWSRTTNPPGSFGSGLLLARAAGAILADLEFVQFHPTAVTGIAGREGFLVTEAIRGEGATLHDGAGERFVDELAPRDHVARAIRTVMDLRGEPCVYLDMRSVDPGRFPNIIEALRESGLDPMLELVPVAPAAHYVMGGIATDLEGRTDVGGLYAVGECACTGLHGANRLASNSLSECFVFGYRAARAGLAGPPSSTPSAPAPADVEPPARATREAVWRDAGLAREPAALRRLLEAPHPLARLVAASALAREESRGAHLRVDHPNIDSALDGYHSVIAAGSGDVAHEEWD